jgi:molecular chaperone DnaJ
VSLERLVACDRCLGNGAEPGTAPIACRTCGGTGQVQSARRSVFGTLMTSAPCPTCEGTGQEIPDRCERCFGAGRLRQPGSVTIEIPAGVADGMELRVAGEGHAGVAGGPAGDLFARLEVAPSGAFERRGQDLHAVLDVTITQAALGARIDVPGLQGRESIDVPAGTDSGSVLRLKGRGVPNLNRRGRGDLFVTLHVVTPKDLTKEERLLLERLAQGRDEAAGHTATANLRPPSF